MNTEKKQVEKEYVINGKPCYQTFMSPWQAMHFLALVEDFEKFIKEKSLSLIDVKSEDSMSVVDITRLVDAIETERPDLLLRAMNVVLKNPKTRKPAYKDDYFTLDDIDGFSPAAICEVVADFFTLNERQKLLQLGSMLKKAMKSST